MHRDWWTVTVGGASKFIFIVYVVVQLFLTLDITLTTGSYYENESIYPICMPLNFIIQKL